MVAPSVQRRLLAAGRNGLDDEAPGKVERAANRPQEQSDSGRVFQPADGESFMSNREEVAPNSDVVKPGQGDRGDHRAN
jgi:hypothetical protein